MLLQKITPNNLESLRRKNVQTVLPGLGRVFHPLPSLIEFVISHHEERLELIQAIVQSAGTNVLTLHEICLQLFHKVFNKDSARFALGEKASHLRFLERKKTLAIARV